MWCSAESVCQCLSAATACVSVLGQPSSNANGSALLCFFLAPCLKLLPPVLPPRPLPKHTNTTQVTL